MDRGYRRSATQRSFLCTLSRHLTANGPAYAALLPDGTAQAPSAVVFSCGLTPLTIGVHVVFGPRQAPIAPAIFGIGLSFLLPSDGISIEIGGIGILENPVLADML